MTDGGRNRILLGVLAAVVLATALRGVQGTAGEAAVDRTQPFRTHANALLVHFIVYPDKPPVIDEVELLPEGRLTIFAPGENQIWLEAEDGAILWSQPFSVSFFLTSDPPVALAEVQFTVVVPNLERARRVVVVTPRGEASREMPP